MTLRWTSAKTHGPVRIQYAETGTAETAVLCIPGLGLPGSIWNQLAGSLAPRYRIITFDPRGAGASDAPPGPYDDRQMADDARSVLDACGVDAAHVVGVSMGGMIALDLATHFVRRVHSLVLVASHAAPHPWTQAVFALRRRLHSTFGAAEQFALAGFLLSSPEALELQPDMFGQLVARYAQAPPDHAAYAAQMEYCTRRRDALPEHVRALAALVIAGESDVLIPAAASRALAGSIPHARFLRYDGASHLIVSECAQRLANDVGAFLRQQTKILTIASRE